MRRGRGDSAPRLAPRSPRGRKRAGSGRLVCLLCLVLACAIVPAVVVHHHYAATEAAALDGPPLRREARQRLRAGKRATAAPTSGTTDVAARVAMVIPYVGSRLPSFFRAFAASCGASRDRIDYLVLVADPAAVPSEARGFVEGKAQAPAWLPENVKFAAVGENRFARLHARIPDGATDDEFPDDSKIDEAREGLAFLIKETFERNPRHLVEFKPTIGVVFREYLEDYSHWAFGDLDVLMGRADAFLEADELENLDVVSWGFGDQWRAYTRGQWTMHKNVRKVNVAYLRCTFLGPAELERRLRSHKHYESCEGCYSKAVAGAGLRTIFAVKHFTDATQKGDRDEAWVVDGEVRRCLDDETRRCRPLAPADALIASRALLATSKAGPWANVNKLPSTAKRCMSWVNPAYQNCLAGGNYGPLDVVIYERSGVYRRRTLDRDPYERRDGGFGAAAFFHFQEWKKKWHSFSAQYLGGTTILATRYGLVPAPPLEVLGAADVLRSRATTARSFEYCAFKACGDDVPAFTRDDLAAAYSKDGGDLLSGGDASHNFPEAFAVDAVGLAVAATFLDGEAPATLARFAANACEWAGPVVLAGAFAHGAAWTLAVDTLRDRFEACGRRGSTLVLGRVGTSGDRAERALANVALDNSPARFDVLLRGAERLSAGAHAAIAAAAAAADGPGTTLVLPTFRVADGDEAALAGLSSLAAAVDAGAAAPGAPDRCEAGADADAARVDALARPAVDAWLAAAAGADARPGPYAALFATPDDELDVAARGAALVLDALDARGDRRLVRELDELRGAGCFDGLLARALAAHQSDRFALVPGAFLLATPANAFTSATPCGCQVDDRAPSKKQRSSVDAYANFLARANRARTEVDAEAEARRASQQNGT